MRDPGRSITVADDSALTLMIGGAQRRIVVLAPALTTGVAKEIAGRWKALGPEAVTVIIDTDPEVYRLGYGDPESLAILEDAARSAGGEIRRQAGIRLGLVIADDSTLVYAPTPLLIEAGPRGSDAPNALMIGSPPPDMARELGQGPHGKEDCRIGSEPVSEAEVQFLRGDLQHNPPRRFDVARTERVFNTHFEFVEFELTGASIERQSVPIPSDLMGLARDERTQRLLKASFRLIDSASGLSGKDLHKGKARLAAEYLTLLPRFGHVILRTNKGAFLKKVGQLEKAVERFQRVVHRRLQAEVDRSRESVVRALIPAVKQSPPTRWKKHIGNDPDEAVMRRLLEDEIRVAFGSASDVVKAMKVRVLFKGVTYESLQDPAFVQTARESLPSFVQLYDEHIAVAAKPTPPGLAR